MCPRFSFVIAWTEINIVKIVVLGVVVVAS